MRDMDPYPIKFNGSLMTRYIPSLMHLAIKLIIAVKSIMINMPEYKRDGLIS